MLGGTMEPMDEFRQLFPHIPTSRIVDFTCGHVVPPSNLCVLAVSQGPSKQSLLLNYQQREQPTLMKEIGLALVNICNIVPHGVVCFFPSYAYMDKIWDAWKSEGLTQRLDKRKHVFHEPREASQVETTLNQYARAIEDGRNALLLCVVGGKMSEGINFADKLGRAVVMVGCPYPNLKSMELQEKMRYIDGVVGQTPFQFTPKSEAYYENLCMRQVNQSIGRAIRHAHDYASIILLDTRYTQDKLRRKLPAWISHDLHACPQFGMVMKHLSTFFQARR
jgi:chromosome transmission fidelity protein 1